MNTFISHNLDVNEMIQSSKVRIRYLFLASVSKTASSAIKNKPY